MSISSRIRTVVDVLLVVHDLDEDGQIGRQIDDVRGMDHARRAKTRDAVKDGGPGEAFLAQAFEARRRASGDATCASRP